MSGQPERAERWVRAPGWDAVLMGEEYVMMSVQHGEYYAVKGVAATVWRALEEPHDLDGLAALVAEEYDVTAEGCRDDVAAFLAQLRDKGMVQPAA